MRKLHELTSQYIELESDLPNAGETCVQINVPDGMEIEIEQKLRQKGIEASNGSPNRVNIRVAI